MQHTIELKHVGPKGHVYNLFAELIARLEDKLGHLPQEAMSLHAVFEENGRHTVYRTALSCHVPGRMVAAHEEGRDAGATIRKAFAEIERQLEKYKAIHRHEYQRRRSKQTRRSRAAPIAAGWILALTVLAQPVGLEAEEPAPAAPTPKAAEALRLLESDDAYERQLGFLRLEALREPATLEAIAKHLDSKDPEMRAYSLRAIAAIQGPASVSLLLDRLKIEKHGRVRRAVFLGLEPFITTDPRILPLCISALRDSLTEIRMAAVDIVSRVDDPRAKEAIRERYRKEGRRDVRRVLKMAMKRMGE